MHGSVHKSVKRGCGVHVHDPYIHEKGVACLIMFNESMKRCSMLDHVPWIHGKERFMLVLVLWIDEKVRALLDHVPWIHEKDMAFSIIFHESINRVWPAWLYSTNPWKGCFMLDHVPWIHEKSVACMITFHDMKMRGMLDHLPYIHEKGCAVLVGLPYVHEKGVACLIIFQISTRRAWPAWSYSMNPWKMVWHAWPCSIYPWKGGVACSIISHTIRVAHLVETFPFPPPPPPPPNPTFIFVCEWRRVRRLRKNFLTTQKGEENVASDGFK